MSTKALAITSASDTVASLRALILEDERHDAELILYELRRNGFVIEPRTARNREEFLSALHEGTFDVILSDYRLPDWTGLDAFAFVRDSGRDIPFLLITGTLGEEAAVECIKQGISDYVLKNHLERLPVALKRSLLEKKLREDAAIAMSALAESEARAREQFAELDLLYRTTPVCFAVFDEDLRFLRVNDAMARNHGIAAEAHIGKSLYELAPEAAKESEAIYRKVFETGTPVLNIEGQIRRTVSPFEMRYYLASFFPLPIPIAGKRAACVMMVDITERRNTEQALRVSEERNRDLVDNSTYGICRLNAEGDFLDANPALLRILGCETMHQFHGLHLFRDIFRFPEQHMKLFQSCLQLGHVCGTEAEWRRADGGFVSVRLQLRLLKRNDAKPEFELIAEDITELRAMERQLLQAQKFEAIGQLAGGIAHDFNNVVGAILGWAEIGYDQSSANPQIADRFSRIREQGERAAALTRELLAFARRQVLQPRLIDLNVVANGLVTFLDRVIGKDIELKILPVPVEPIKADPTQIEQVIMNLCLNARDAMPTGGRLLIETEMVDLDDAYCRFYPHVVPGRYAVLSVSDTGVGMDAETRDRIFEPFFTTKEPGKGTGMGLASVYGIVKQHGGFVHVYSEVEQGTLFRVYLPSTTDGAAQTKQVRNSVAAGPEPRGTELILLAEDHESIREMARHTLLNLGYRVLCAADGEEAIRLIDRDRPALAVLDVVMPKLGGQATAGQLLQRFPGLPVIFTSGYSQDAAGFPASTTEMKYLQKPYSPTALGKLVRHVLDHYTPNVTA
ncbi:MAG TPA: response regulator [Candidatus Dormibacteraeota bacterium]|jgi:two-component system cell cycle sensor histidine kinase/response regulator CckA|nr:response regulator [Candidatus Dormibacteraeota bacterium]